MTKIDGGQSPIDPRPIQVPGINGPIAGSINHPAEEVSASTTLQKNIQTVAKAVSSLFPSLSPKATSIVTNKTLGIIEEGPTKFTA